MMGRNHAASGAASGLATYYLLCHAGVDLTTMHGGGSVPSLIVFTSPLHMAATCALVTAGAAVLPDLDQPEASMANSLGPITRGLAHLVHRLAGGHRRGTHSLFGVAVTGLVFALLIAITGPVGALISLFLFSALGTHCIRIRSSKSITARGHRALRKLGPLARPVCWIVRKAQRVARIIGWILAASVIIYGVLLGWAPLFAHLWLLPVLVMIGCLTHIVGDMLTVQGCPLAWPLPAPGHAHTSRTDVERKYLMFRFPLLGHADSWRENLIMAPLLWIGCGLMLFGVN